MSRHFPALPLDEQSIDPRVPLEFRSAACHSLADLLDKGSALDIPGGETSAVISPDNENKSRSAAHNGLVTRPHSTSSTSSGSTDWPISGFSELTVTRALITCPSTGSVIVSPQPGIDRPKTRNFLCEPSPRVSR